MGAFKGNWLSFRVRPGKWSEMIKTIAKSWKQYAFRAVNEITLSKPVHLGHNAQIFLSQV